MTNLSTLKSLQARIREATGADRELDLAIQQTFRPDDFVVMHRPLYTTDPDGLGACVALMREVLPRWTWGRDWFGNISVVDIEAIRDRNANSIRLANDCLTLLDAICAALIAEEEAKEKADV